MAISHCAAQTVKHTCAGRRGFGTSCVGSIAIAQPGERCTVGCDAYRLAFNDSRWTACNREHYQGGQICYIAVMFWDRAGCPSLT